MTSNAHGVPVYRYFVTIRGTEVEDGLVFYVSLVATEWLMAQIMTNPQLYPMGDVMAKLAEVLA